LALLFISVLKQATTATPFSSHIVGSLINGRLPRQMLMDCVNRVFSFCGV